MNQGIIDEITDFFDEMSTGTRQGLARIRRQIELQMIEQYYAPGLVGKAKQLRRQKKKELAKEAKDTKAILENLVGQLDNDENIILIGQFSNQVRQTVEENAKGYDSF